MSSPRSGFVLDAKSMGLKRLSRPPSPSASAKGVDNPNDDRASTSSKQILAMEGGPEMEPCGSHAQCNASTETLTTDYYRELLQKLRDETGDAGQVNFKLNSIFLKRLDEIDGLNGQSGDSALRLVTYQEWVDLLLQVNSVLVGNMSDLEEEAYGKIVSYFNSVQGQQQQALEENRMLRKDLCSIIKLVQGRYHHNRWDFEGISLETLSVNQLLGLKLDQARPESEDEKMAECMKSLVNEMAEKHDEICHLKTQLGTLDEVVLTARQKLLLKDQCIAQLNQQLQEINQSLAKTPQQTPCLESSTDVTEDLEPESDPSRVEEGSSESMTNCMLQSLTIQDGQENEILRLLDKELEELFRVHNIHEHQVTETWRGRLSKVYAKMASERNDMLKKLENIRSQLSLLNSDLDRNPVTFSPAPPPIDDPDSKMVECLRGKLHTLHLRNRELHGKYHRLDTESKINTSDLEAKLEFESGLNQRNSQVLREIADLICKLSPTEFSYNEMYAESSTENPFCVAINQIFQQRSPEELRMRTNKSDTKTQSQTKDSIKARPAAMAKTKSTTRPTTKPKTATTTTTPTTTTTKPTTKPTTTTTTTRPRSSK